MIGIPVNRWLSPKTTISISKIVDYLRCDSWTIDINYDNGTIISDQRNTIFKSAHREHMHLLFIDSDMVFDATALETMLFHWDAGDLIGGLCFMRRFPFKPVVFSEDVSETEGVFRGWPYSKIPSYPFKCAGVGCAFLLIKYPTIDKILEKNNVPFRHHVMPNNDILGEDLSFMHVCNEMGLDIICMPNIEVGHISEQVITRRNHIQAMEAIKEQKVSAALP